MIVSEKKTKKQLCICAAISKNRMASSVQIAGITRTHEEGRQEFLPVLMVAMVYIKINNLINDMII